MLVPVDPDGYDLFLASHIVLKPCPSCGAHAGPVMTSVNPDGWSGPVYRSIIECSNIHDCGFSVGYNGRTKDEAMTCAMTRWEDRRPAAERFAAREWKRRSA